MYNSPVFDILNAAFRMGLLNTVYGMINGSIQVYSKKAWSEYVWSQARKLEDAFWQSTFVLNQNCKYLYSTMGSARYLTWWAISDKFPSTLRMCENLAKIICRCSKLKTDDFRNKGLTHSYRACNLCNMYATENIEHLIMQCPVYESMRDRMFKDNRKSSQVYSDALDANPEKTFLWIMGGQIEGLEFEQMLDLWLIAGCVINQIYKETIKSHPCVK